ncbi:MAG: hypothetical protein ACKVU2_09940 [Saprospiraceae bacterium]
MSWLRTSIVATDGRGSSHSYSPVWGWTRAYPETTGYLIPTLLQYADLMQDDILREMAERCRRWLLDIQLPNGAWAGGMAGETRPSVFNTAMILWGVGAKTPPGHPHPLPRGGGGLALNNTCSPEAGCDSIPTHEKPAMRDARASPTGEKLGMEWLLSTLSPDGAWRNGAYIPGFVPSYYTYAVWSLLEAGARLGLPDVQEQMRTALCYYARRIQSDSTVADWGLKPGQWAFTHTIAYTLQGFWESALLLGEEDILEKTARCAEGLLAELDRSGHVAAGRYGPGWQGDYSFTCPVGNAQLSIFFRRLWEKTGAEKFERAAGFFLAEALRFQNLEKNPNCRGALPGSAPFWGPYLRWRYPNWGVKFLLDAMADKYR